MPPAHLPNAARTTAEHSLAERLERGEIEYYPVCPFSVPTGEDLTFLLEQRLASRAHKNISYDPRTRRIKGYYPTSPAQAERLRSLLASFQQSATGWLARMLPD